MPKYYLRKGNGETDQNIAEAPTTDYAILMNSSQVRFFKDGHHIINLNWSGTPMPLPAKSIFANKLSTNFNKFFNGDSPAGTGVTNNAFAYMRSNGVEGNKF